MLQLLAELEGNRVGVVVAAMLDYDLCVLFRAAMLSSPETKLAASDYSPGSSSTSMRWGLPCGKRLQRMLIRSCLELRRWLQESKMAASKADGVSGHIKDKADRRVQALAQTYLQSPGIIAGQVEPNVV